MLSKPKNEYISFTYLIATKYLLCDLIQAVLMQVIHIGQMVTVVNDLDVLVEMGVHMSPLDHGVRSVRVGVVTNGIMAVSNAYTLPLPITFPSASVFSDPLLISRRTNLFPHGSCTTAHRPI